MSAASLIEAPAAAKLLGISVPRLYELSREGIVPSVRLGRSFRYSPSALNDFIQRGGDGWAGGWKKATSVSEPADHLTSQDRES